MASVLQSVIKATSRQAPKGIVYGPPGIGKTTFASRATKPILVDCENGAGSVQVERTPYLSTWLEIKRWLASLKDEPHEYRTIVIDSLDWMIRRAEEFVSNSADDLKNTLNRSHGGYGNGKQVLKNLVYQEIIPTLDKLVGKGLAVLLICHAQRTKDTDVDGIETEKVAPDLPPDMLNTFVEWSDFVFLARHGKDSRCLVTEGTDRAIAKNRYGLPPVLPLDWAAVVAAMSAKK
jgi:hypothetical protein